jgi:hypothetical protein
LTPGSSRWFPSLRFPHQNSVCTSPPLHTGHKPCPSQSPTKNNLHKKTECNDKNLDPSVPNSSIDQSIIAIK